MVEQVDQHDADHADAEAEIEVAAGAAGERQSDVAGQAGIGAHVGDLVHHSEQQCVDAHAHKGEGQVIVCAQAKDVDTEGNKHCQRHSADDGKGFRPAQADDKDNVGIGAHAKVGSHTKGTQTAETEDDVQCGGKEHHDNGAAHKVKHGIYGKERVDQHAQADDGTHNGVPLDLRNLLPGTKHLNGPPFW